VGYDPVLAQKQDDGIFWIAWDDVLVYFQNIHLSWNPALFSFRTTIHGFWPLNHGPMDDTFNVGENPQHILHLSDSAVSKKATIWILLSRHVTKQEQEGSEATDYLTVHVYRNNGKRDIIWYTGGNVLTGAYTNNPHVLMRYDVSGPADKYLSLVLSQYKRSHDLSFTLSCFCTEPFSLSQPAKGLPHCREISFEWTMSTAGGPPGSSTFQQNPMWAVQVPDEGASIQMRVNTLKSYAVNAMLVSVEIYGQRVKQLTREPSLDSGDYRNGFTITEKRKVPGGMYTIIVSTFTPGQVGKFKLSIASSSKLRIENIP
jgi:calpain-7